MNEVREQARGWLVRQAGDGFSAADQRAFESWYAADPAHARAYEKVARLWQALPQTASADFVVAARSEARAALHAQRDRPRALRLGFLRVAFASLLLVAVVAGGMRLVRNSNVEATVAVATTARGEQRILMLPDGSRVTLAAASELDWSIAGDARRLTLRRGQAFFEVAKDAARPFVVTAGEGTVTALGTAFDVRLAPHGVTVTLLEGRVAVQPIVLQSARVAPTMLAAGEQVSIGDGGGVTAPRAAPGEATAWRVGKLVFIETPLEDVVAEINRYSKRPVTIGDEKLRALHVNGVFRTSNVDTLVEALGASFPLRPVDDGHGGIVLLATERT